MTLSAAIATITPWALRIARTVAFMMFALVPIHSFVPCNASGIVAEFAVILLCVVAGLSIVGRKFKPFCLALVAMLLHMASAH